MSDNKEKLEGLMTLVKGLSDTVKGLKDSHSKWSDEADKKLTDLMQKREEVMRTDLITRFRKGEHLEPLDDEKVPPAELLVRKSADPKVREWQSFNDDVYIVSKILRCHPTQTKIWRQNQNQATELRKALAAATASQGADWIPTEFSADLIDKFRLSLKVAALFRRIQMPSNPYTFPAVASDSTAYLISEATSDTESKIDASTPGTTNFTLTAKKLAARVLFSEEVNEDSIIPILPWVKDNLAIANGDAMEKATLDGDTNHLGHRDLDVTSGKDCRKAYEGLRKLAATGGRQKNLGTFSKDTVRSMKTAMGKYGINPRDLCWITGPKGYAQLLNLTEVTTVDKYGPAATILSGELAKLDGIPIIVSEHIRENLNAAGIYDSTTTDNTVLILVWIPGFMFGDRRKITMKTFEDIQTDQTILVTTLRAAFGNPYNVASNAIVNVGYNVDAA